MKLITSSNWAEIVYSGCMAHLHCLELESRSVLCK